MKALLCCLLGMFVCVSAAARVCSDSAPSSAPRPEVVSNGFAMEVESTTMSKDRREAADVEAGQAGTQASMVITGRITVGPDGSVSKYSLDRQSEISPAVRQLVGEAVPGWRFKPIEGTNGPVAAQALMSLRIVARQTSAGAYTAAIRSALFGTAASEASGSCASGCLAYRQVVHPRFPTCELMQDVTGTAYAAIQIGDDGRVTKAAVMQVDLRNAGTPAEVESWRKGLASAVMAVVSQWTFSVPDTGAQARPKSWAVFVPIDFYTNPRQVAYGKWDLYYPGPVHQPAWANGSGGAATSDSADAVPPDSTMYEPDPRFVLLTPPGGLPPSIASKPASG